MRPSIAHNTTFGVKMCGICGGAIAPQQRHDSCHIKEMEDEIGKLKHDTEALIVAAYKRGAAWANENPGDGEFLDKAARDYADYTMNAPSTEVEKISTDTEVR